MVARVCRQREPSAPWALGRQDSSGVSGRARRGVAWGALSAGLFVVSSFAGATAAGAAAAGSTGLVPGVLPLLLWEEPSPGAGDDPEAAMVVTDPVLVGGAGAFFQTPRLVQTGASLVLGPATQPLPPEVAGVVADRYFAAIAAADDGSSAAAQMILAANMSVNEFAPLANPVARPAGRAGFGLAVVGVETLRILAAIPGVEQSFFGYAVDLLELYRGTLGFS